MPILTRSGAPTDRHVESRLFEKRTYRACKTLETDTRTGHEKCEDKMEGVLWVMSRGESSPPLDIVNRSENHTGIWADEKPRMVLVLVSKHKLRHALTSLSRRRTDSFLSPDTAWPTVLVPVLTCMECSRSDHAQIVLLAQNTHWHLHAHLNTPSCALALSHTHTHTHKLRDTHTHLKQCAESEQSVQRTSRLRGSFRPGDGSSVFTVPRSAGVSKSYSPQQRVSNRSRSVLHRNTHTLSYTLALSWGPEIQILDEMGTQRHTRTSDHTLLS